MGPGRPGVGLRAPRRDEGLLLRGGKQRRVSPAAPQGTSLHVRNCGDVPKGDPRGLRGARWELPVVLTSCVFRYQRLREALACLRLVLCPQILSPFPGAPHCLWFIAPRVVYCPACGLLPQPVGGRHDAERRWTPPLRLQHRGGWGIAARVRRAASC